MSWIGRRRRSRSDVHRIDFTASCASSEAAELRQQETAKQRSRPASEPRVDADERPVMLLDLFLAQGRSRRERGLEARLEARGLSAIASAERDGRTEA